MTFNKIVYIYCKDLNALEKTLRKGEMMDLVSHKYDNDGQKEVWVPIDDDSDVINCISDYLTPYEKERILTEEVDTILFY